MENSFLKLNVHVIEIETLYVVVKEEAPSCLTSGKCDSKHL